jgi:hypothetical protein
MICSLKIKYPHNEEENKTTENTELHEGKDDSLITAFGSMP